MPCEEYKRLESDKRMADENAVINSSTRSMWLAKSAELREYMGRKRSRLVNRAAFLSNNYATRGLKSPARTLVGISASVTSSQLTTCG
jgi:hypothetical protein